MRTLTALVLLLGAVAVASLTTDRSDVGSQITLLPIRVYVPAIAKLDLDVGEPTLALRYTVIIRAEARDAEPEACCLDRWTQFQLDAGDFLPRGTRDSGIQIYRWTDPWPDRAGEDYEGCKWRRQQASLGGIRIGGTDDIWNYGEAPLVVIEVGGPEWSYQISGCRDLANPISTQKRSLDEYMKAVFPDHLSQGGNYFVFDTPLALVVGRPCVSHYGSYSGEAENVNVSIEIWIYPDGCAIPAAPFPFKPPRT
ncbi:MAG: hypothetical protein HY875_02790 [Chloroflexi bacterium]|nr:hypothetical protein [Chloroflexota bacterium]